MTILLKEIYRFNAIPIKILMAFFLRNSFFFFNYLFIYLFIFAVLDLHFCARAFSSCGKRGPLFIVVHGPLTIAASLFAEHRLQTRRLSSCGPWAQLLCSMWDLPRPGLKPVSPALAGRLSTTAPPGKPPNGIFHKTRTNNSKVCMETQKTPNSQSNLVKEEQGWRYHARGHQTIQQSYSNQNSIVLAQKQIHRSMEQNREPRNKPTHLESTHLWQRRQEYKVGKRQSLQ